MFVISVDDDRIKNTWEKVKSFLPEERDCATDFRELTGYFLAIENGGQPATIIFDNEEQMTAFILRWS